MEHDSSDKPDGGTQPSSRPWKTGSPFTLEVADIKNRQMEECMQVRAGWVGV